MNLIQDVIEGLAVSKLEDFLFFGVLVVGLGLILSL